MKRNPLQELKFKQDMIENSENKFENTHHREVGFVCVLLLVFELKLIQLQVSRSTVMGGSFVKLGKRVFKWVYERTGLSSLASDWVTFLVDFSSELFVGIRPRRFLWWARNSLL